MDDQSHDLDAASFSLARLEFNFKRKEIRIRARERKRMLHLDRVMSIFIWKMDEFTVSGSGQSQSTYNPRAQNRKKNQARGFNVVTVTNDRYRKTITSSTYTHASRINFSTPILLTKQSFHRRGELISGAWIQVEEMVFLRRAPKDTYLPAINMTRFHTTNSSSTTEIVSSGCWWRV